jgi:hypothetical protein
MIITIKQIKEHLKEAREKGWWIACFYWELKLEELLDEPKQFYSNCCGAGVDEETKTCLKCLEPCEIEE